jgi:hypothetical protein
LLFIAIQFVHPPDEMASVTTTLWTVTAAMTLAFGVLALIGVSGVYFRRAEAIGVLGLVGFLMLALFFLLVTAFSFAELVIVPKIATEAPHFVEAFLTLFSQDGPAAGLGALRFVAPLAGALYMAGGVLFGTALYLALTRCVDAEKRQTVRGGLFGAAVVHLGSGVSAALLAGGALAPLLRAFIPEGVGRFTAIPVALALIGLGYGLWAEHRSDGHRSDEAAFATVSPSS